MTNNNEWQKENIDLEIENINKKWIYIYMINQFYEEKWLVININQIHDILIV